MANALVVQLLAVFLASANLQLTKADVGDSLAIGVEDQQVKPSTQCYRLNTCDPKIWMLKPDSQNDSMKSLGW